MQWTGYRTIIVLTIGLLSLGCHLTPDLQAKVEELRHIAAETPRFPDFQQIDYSQIAKPEGTVIAYFYRSSASYEEVKNFYTGGLTSRGWSLVKEEPWAQWFTAKGQRLTFTKEKYSIDIEHDSSRGSGWDFAVGYAWDDNERKMK
jgi:hypothetical protein